MIASTGIQSFDAGIGIDGHRNDEGGEQRAAQRRGDQRGRRHGQQQHHRLDDRELVDLAGVAAERRRNTPSRGRSAKWPIRKSLRVRSGVELGGFGALDAPRDEGEAGIADDA